MAEGAPLLGLQTNQTSLTEHPPDQRFRGIAPGCEFNTHFYHCVSPAFFLEKRRLKLPPPPPTNGKTNQRVAFVFGSDALKERLIAQL